MTMLAGASHTVKIELVEPSLFGTLVSAAAVIVLSTLIAVAVASLFDRLGGGWPLALKAVAAALVPLALYLALFAWIEAANETPGARGLFGDLTLKSYAMLAVSSLAAWLAARFVLIRQAMGK